MVSHKGTYKKIKMFPSECHHTSICDSKRGGGGLAREEKVGFVLDLLGPILPAHYQRLHKKNISGVETEATGELYLLH